MFVTIFLIGSIFYISTLLTSGDENKTSQVAPRKTKAANITYSKLIALNQVTPETTPTAQAEDTTSGEETESITETPTQTGETVSVTGVESITETPTPTPTETVLAYANPTVTDTASSEADTTTTLTPTKVKNLPDTGFIYNGLIIFAAAMVLVFFSFLF